MPSPWNYLLVAMEIHNTHAKAHDAITPLLTIYQNVRSFMGCGCSCPPEMLVRSFCFLCHFLWQIRFTLIHETHKRHRERETQRSASETEGEQREFIPFPSFRNFPPEENKSFTCLESRWTGTCVVWWWWILTPLRLRKFSRKRPIEHVLGPTKQWRRVL